jgi:hypothetical protein
MHNFILVDFFLQKFSQNSAYEWAECSGLILVV